MYVIYSKFKSFEEFLRAHKTSSIVVWVDKLKSLSLYSKHMYICTDQSNFEFDKRLVGIQTAAELGLYGDIP